MASTLYISTQAEHVRCRILDKLVSVGEPGETVPLTTPVIDNYDLYKAHLKNLGTKIPLFAKFATKDLSRTRLMKMFEEKLAKASTSRQVTADTNLVTVDTATILNLKRQKVEPSGQPKSSGSKSVPVKGPE